MSVVRIALSANCSVHIIFAMQLLVALMHYFTINGLIEEQGPFTWPVGMEELEMNLPQAN